MTSGAGDRPAAPSASPASSGPAEDLPEELRRRVAERRAAGEYPAELEARLGRHYEQVRQHRADYDRIAPLRRAVAEVHDASQFALGEPDTRSRLAGGSQYHQMVGRAVSRHLTPIVAQLQSYAAAMDNALQFLLDRLDDPGQHRHVDLVEQVDALGDRVDRIETDPESAAVELAALRERVAALEAAVRVRPWWSPARYHERFAERLGAPAPPKGIDGPEPVVALDADTGLAPLVAIDDRGAGTITVMDGIESFTRQAVADLPVLAWAKLRQHGQLVVAGTDPASPEAATRASVDLRWRGAVDADLMVFLCEAAGFAPVEMHTPAPNRYVVRATHP